MTEVFIDTFLGTGRAVLQLMLIALAAGILVRNRILSQDQVKALSAIIIKILLPCLIFSNIMKNFQPGELSIWPLIPLVAIAMVGVGLLAAAVLFARQLPEKKNMLSLASIHNASYLVLPIGSILFADQFETFKLYCFLYILGISPILWTLGKYLVSSTPGRKINLCELITPPFVANLLGLILVFTHIRDFVPMIVLDPIEFIGSATIPLAIFILGAVLGTISFDFRPYLLDGARVTVIKLILLPVCTIAVLYATGMGVTYPLLASFFVLEASSAPATATLIQVKHYGGDEHKISSIILINYICCIITIPFWMAVWKTISS